MAAWMVSPGWTVKVRDAPIFKGVVDELSGAPVCPRVGMGATFGGIGRRLKTRIARISSVAIPDRILAGHFIQPRRAFQARYTSQVVIPANTRSTITQIDSISMPDIQLRNPGQGGH